MSIHKEKLISNYKILRKKYQKIYLCLLATIINTLEKNPKFKFKTPPQVNKKGKRLFTQFNNCLTSYYIEVNLHLYNIKVRG